MDGRRKRLRRSAIVYERNAKTWLEGLLIEPTHACEPWQPDEAAGVGLTRSAGAAISPQPARNGGSAGPRTRGRDPAKAAIVPACEARRRLVAAWSYDACRLVGSTGLAASWCSSRPDGQTTPLPLQSHEEDRHADDVS